MKFGKAFSYIFQDKEWFKKIVIVALCGLIPVVGQFIVIGYAFKVMKRLIEEGMDTPLPVLEFGADLGKGFMVTVINAIYMIPLFLLMGIGAGIMAAGQSADQTVMIILMILGGCFGLLGLIIGLLLGFMAPAAVANFAAKGEFKAAFKLKEVFGLVKKSFVSWLLVLVGGLLAGVIAPIGSIACGNGVILTSTYAVLLSNHLIGQAYNASVTPKMGEVEL
jgi:hypothetical protein